MVRLASDRSSGFDGRTHFFPCRAFSGASENEEVEEVHYAKDEHHHAELTTAGFEDALGVGDIEIEFHVKSYEADVDEVKSHDQQVVHAVGELFVAVKTIHKKDTTAFVQRACDPDREGDGDAEIDAVGDDCLMGGVVHGVGFLRCVFCCFCLFFLFRK